MKFSAMILVSLLLAGQAHASIMTYEDRNIFESATGAADVGDLTRNADGVEFSVGPLDFKNANGSNLNTFRNFSTLIDEDWDLGLSGPEHFDVFSNDNLYAFGFDFHEPTNTTPSNPSFPDSCNTPTCVESLFEVSLLLDGVFVGSAQFERDNDQLTFFGISSSNEFNEILVRELVGNSDNEFFGNFTVATAVPAPATLLILMLGLLGVFARPR